MGKLSVSPGEHISQRADPPSSFDKRTCFSRLLLARLLPCAASRRKSPNREDHLLPSTEKPYIDQLGVGPRFGPSACRTRRWLFPFTTEPANRANAGDLANLPLRSSAWSTRSTVVQGFRTARANMTPRKPPRYPLKIADRSDPMQFVDTKPDTKAPKTKKKR